MRSFPLALLAVLVTTTATVGCGKDRDVHPIETTGSATAAAPAPTPSAAPASAPSASAKPVEHVELALQSVANTMAYDKTKLTVPAGAEVHLTLKNNSTMATLPHNWVLVKPGTEASVAAAGLKLGEPAGYFDVTDKDALAHTPLAKPGTTVEVTFTAPPPGNYPYICTVVGHYVMMKGVLTVTP